MSSKQKTCPYKACYLPDNNTKYWIQATYLLISGLYLIADVKEFTFFSVLMFTAPILLDLTSTKMYSKLFTAVSRFFIILNTLIAVFCFAGMFGLFEDKGDAFFVSDKSMVLANQSFEKRWLLVPIVINLIIPIMMYHACPSKRTRAIINVCKEYEEVG